MEKWIIIYMIAMNLLGFALMGIDKRNAVRHKWRIPEKTFFIVSLLSGSLGTWAGMQVFRHKTRHWYFVIGIPLIFVLQVFAAYYILKG